MIEFKNITKCGTIFMNLLQLNISCQLLSNNMIYMCHASKNRIDSRSEICISRSSNRSQRRDHGP